MQVGIIQSSPLGQTVKMMKFRLPLLAGFVAMLFGLALAVACTDTPSVTGNDGNGGNDNDAECDDGYEFDPDLEECVESSNDDDNSFNDSLPDPDELDPWGDESGDGIPNQYDNCPFHHNPDQTDTAGDGVGDVCDNCPHLANPDQAASPDNPVWPDRYDANGNPMVMGDACVPGNEYVDDVTDSSGDGVPDVMDNCPEYFNPPVEPGCCPESDPYCEECWCQCPDDQYPCEGCAQVDSSGDGVGDICDNCPDHYNPNQTVSPGNPEWPDHYDHDGNPIVMGDACAPEPGNIPICDTQETQFETLEPNVYIVLDLSGSMGWYINSNTSAPVGQRRWDYAVEGLDLIADELHNEIQFGLGVFPPPGGGCSNPLGHELDMDLHTAQAIKDSYHQHEPNGGTPMWGALHNVLQNNRVSKQGDPQDDQRIKAVLLVTDGEPTCENVSDVTNKIAELYDNDILTFVVGFAHDTQSLIDFAQAGGTGDRYLADDAESLADAMRDVADLLISCDYVLQDTPEDPNKIWVSVDGEYLDPADYTYQGGTVTLNQDACDYVRSFDVDTLDLKIEMGCASECVPEEPQGLCDLYYETCGEPYPCEECSPEICDGQDNNCSGVIDDNCPDCAIFEAPCETTEDCCEPYVCNDEGFCDHACYPDGTSCRSNDRCCSGNCAMTDGDVGTCISG